MGLLRHWCRLQCAPRPVALFALYNLGKHRGLNCMASKYRISQELDGIAVSLASTGQIIATFGRRDQAEEYLVAQLRADEQSQVLAAYNEAEEIRCLAAEFAAELAS